jgi:hypothetical protein
MGWSTIWATFSQTHLVTLIVGLAVVRFYSSGIVIHVRSCELRAHRAGHRNLRPRMRMLKQMGEFFSAGLHPIL